MLTPNAAGLVVNSVNNTQAIRWEGEAANPIEGSGLKIGQDNAKIREVVEQLKRHNAAVPDAELSINMALIVHPDSFDTVGEFQKLIQTVGGVKEGWQPVLEETVLNVGDKGAKVKVQN